MADQPTPSNELNKPVGEWKPREAPLPADLQTLAPGARCSITVAGGKDVPGIVAGVAVYSGRITYQVIWWDGKIRREEWLEEFEVWGHPKQNMFKIGFDRTETKRLYGEADLKAIEEEVEKLPRSLEEAPWAKANDHGEAPGDICCQRAAGRYCWEHDPANYATDKIIPMITHLINWVRERGFTDGS